jgi:glycosyltransferase involved in cell wall biosynthesis
MVTSSYPRHQTDSASVFLRYLAESLGRRGVRVHVLCPEDHAGGTPAESGITVRGFRYFPRSLQRLAYGSGILSNLKQNPWLWFQVPFFLVSLTYSLIREVRSRRPDIIHAHWLIPQGLVAVLVKRLCRVPVVITAHGADLFALKSPPMRALKHFALRRCDAWTSNTRATAEPALRHGKLPTPQLIPMGINVALFRPDLNNNSSRPPEAEFLLLFIGRLVEKKGCGDLLTAFSLLPKALQVKSALWIVGDGVEAARLKQQSSALGLDQRVRFWGRLGNYLLPEFYAAADLFVAPSVEAASGDTEGQGVVILEAFASGTCVAATRVGGISEVIEDGVTGVLVEPRNPLKLSVAIEQLLHDPERRRRLAENALRKVREKYAWEKIAAEFHRVYRDVALK